MNENLINRISFYLASGGLFNPELADHIAVRTLLFECREALAQPESEYERGFIDGMQKQMQSSVDKAVNAMTQPTYYIPNKDERTWVGLTGEDLKLLSAEWGMVYGAWMDDFARAIEAKLKEKNHG